MNTEIEGVILAGGESKRMGTNKSLIKLHTKPLIKHVYDRLIEQVSHVSINTNQPIKIFPKNIYSIPVMIPSYYPIPNFIEWWLMKTPYIIFLHESTY